MRRRGWWHMSLLLLLAAALAIALLIVERQDRAIKQNRDELLEQAAPLEKRRDALIAQRDRQERAYRDETMVPATEQLVFLELDPLLYTEIFPVLREREIPAVLGLYAGNFPGDPGRISRGEFDELLAAGWELCLVCEDGEIFGQWDQDMTQRLAEAGIAKPVTVYFPENAFLPELTEEILSSGYTVAVHHGEGRLKLIAGDAGESLWLAGAHPWNYTGVRDEIRELVRLGGEHSFTLRFSEGREEYTAGGFETMLNFIQTYRENGTLQVTGFVQARELHNPEKNGTAAAQAKWEQENAALEEEIRALDAEIQAIYAGWNGEKDD